MKGAMEKDVVTVRIFEEDKIALGISSIVGTRKNQEDSIYGHVEGGNAIGIVCDGMGGLQGGEAASNAAVESLAEAWYGQKDIGDIPEFLKNQAVAADEKVFYLQNEKGEPLRAGTTIVAVIVQDKKL